MKFYHVDTENKINKTNMDIEFKQIPRIWKNYSLLKERYKEGLSQWGLTILGVQYQFESEALNLSFKEPRDTDYYWNSYLIDILYEYERIANFPHVPSRFQSIFASESLSTATLWKKTMNVPNAKIYEIDINHTEFIKVDSKYLNCQIDRFDLSAVQNNASLYFSGEMKKKRFSLPEYIVKLPVHLSQEVLDFSERYIP